MRVNGRIEQPVHTVGEKQHRVLLKSRSWSLPMHVRPHPVSPIGKRLVPGEKIVEHPNLEENMSLL